MKLRSITAHELSRHTKARWRPTVKFVVQSKCGAVVIPTSGSDKHHHIKKANLPGGGVDTGDVIACAIRELQEEFPNLKFDESKIPHCRLLMKARVTTSKSGWRGKYL